MKKFVSILVSMVLILMAATTTAFAATTDMEVRLSGVKDGKILAEKQSDYGDWFYVVKWSDERFVIMDAFLEEYIEFEDLDRTEEELENIDWDMVLDYFLEDDLLGILDEVLGEEWGDWDEEDDEWMSDDEWTQFWDDLWEEEVLTGKSFMT